MRRTLVAVTLGAAALAITLAHPPRVAGQRAGQGAAASDPVIRFDSKGVDFGAWIRRFTAQIKHNWDVPPASMSLKGQVIVAFVVHKDGLITDVRIMAPCPVQGFNDAALTAISASNPTYPFPPGYPDQKAQFTVTFFYNESPPADARTSHVILLSSHRVIVECDADGVWTSIYAVADEPVAPGDEQALRAAQKTADGRATSQISTFFRQQVPAELVAGEIERALTDTVARQGAGAAGLSPEALRVLAAGIVESRRAYATGTLTGSPLLETGYDANRQVAWAKVGVARKTAPAMPPGGISGGIVGALPGAPPPPAPMAPVRVGGNIKPPTKIKDVRPAYPEAAQEARIQGMVVIEAVIGPDGIVQSAHVLRSIPELDQSALDAVRQWAFTPTLVNGVPVPVIMTVTVNFTLK